MKDLWWIIREVFPYWPRACLAVVLSALTVTSHIGLMATSSYLLARAALQPPIMDLMITIVGVRFFGISRAVLRYAERLVSHDVTFRVLGRIRVKIYEGIEPLVPAHLKELRSGDLLSRIVGDVEVQQNLFLRILAPPLVAALILLGYGIFLAQYNQGFAYILAACFLLAGLVLPFFVRLLGRGMGELRVQAKAKLHTSVADSLLGMSEMLSFGQKGTIMQKVQEAQKELSQADRRAAKVTGFSNAFMGMISNLGMLAVLALGVILVQQAQLDGVLLGMLALGVLSSFEAVVPMPVAQQHLEENQASGKRLKSLLDAGQDELHKEEARVYRRLGAKESPETQSLVDPVLEFAKVYFRYAPEDPWALENISFKIPQGKRIGIVGESGAGKSSIINLLVRFWEPELGEIRFQGINIQELHPDELRERIGVVSQRPHLFHATVKENLQLAKPDAMDEEIIKATRLAKIHDFILSLPQGYDTLIGEEGMKFSGGQQQRLALARVLLKDAPVLILDEATNGLDPILEQELMQEIMTLTEGKVLIVITHSLELTKNLDEILVLDKGKIVEQGKHEELLKNKGKYYQLWEIGKSMA